jgi:hypothetical protein
MELKQDSYSSLVNNPPQKLFHPDKQPKVNHSKKENFYDKLLSSIDTPIVNGRIRIVPKGSIIETKPNTNTNTNTNTNINTKPNTNTTNQLPPTRPYIAQYNTQPSPVDKSILADSTTAEQYKQYLQSQLGKQKPPTNKSTQMQFL